MSDKGQHALLTYSVFLTGALLLNIWWGVAGALLWSLGKEYIDRVSGKYWDWWDILADLCGLLAGLVLMAGWKWEFVFLASSIVVGLILIDKNK